MSNHSVAITYIYNNDHLFFTFNYFYLCACLPNRKLAQEEMDSMMSQQSVFSFPTEEELANVTNLKDIQQRIRDIVMVLSDFKRLRDKDRPRSDYTDLLQQDLCTYYSYNDFLMLKLIQTFPLDELLEYLEASEVQRPMTIRTNTLKTRRRDLAEVHLFRLANVASKKFLYLKYKKHLTLQY